MDAAPPTVVDRPAGSAVGPAELPPTPEGRISLGAAVVALVCFAVAVVLVSIPVRTPGVQDCGTPTGYLLEGRLDVVPDAQDRILGPDGQPLTLDEETAQAAREHPCQERVADRAVPAGVLVLAGTLLGLAAFAVEVLVVRPRRRRAWRAAVQAAPPVPLPTPGSGPTTAPGGDTTSPWGQSDPAGPPDRPGSPDRTAPVDPGAAPPSPGPSSPDPPSSPT